MRLLIEFLIAGVAVFLIVSRTGTDLYLPFFSGVVLELGPLYYVFAMVLIVGFGNAVNLTDGLDGLATFPVIIASLTFLVIVYLTGNVKFAEYLGIPHVSGAGELAVFAAAIIGACLAFLWFNAPPAAVFMGDTGSLALGGALATIAVTAQHELVLVLVGGLFVVEALVGDHPGVLVQAHRQAGVPHGADPPSFRTIGLARIDRRHPFLDRVDRPCARGTRDLETAVITSRAFAGRRYAVLGLARSGLATVEALVASGAGVTAWDDREEARDDAMALGADIGNPLDIDLIGFAGVVVSPGVPLNRHPIAAHAREAHVPVIGDVELFAEARGDLPPHKIVGITGTNGKSTVTALIHHMLESAGVPSLMGGNIGLPILSRDPLPEGGVYVLELSSYQIDLSHSLACDVAVLTNLSPDHLDRYDGFTGYAASKARLFGLQHRDQVAIVAVDDDPSKMIASRINHRLHRVSGKDIDPVDQHRWPALQGPHNAQNAVCAIAVCRVLGLNDEQIERGLATYTSLPHRMELVGEVAGVRWFNDSKATNAASAAPALAAFPPAPDQRLHWIAGGQAKGDGLAACRPWFGHVKRAYLIGDAMEPFAAEIGDAVPVDRSGDMATAVAHAAAAAKPGDIVLLSPACASFDQFKDYEQRGDVFRGLVQALGA